MIKMNTIPILLQDKSKGIKNTLKKPVISKITHNLKWNEYVLRYKFILFFSIFSTYCGNKKNYIPISDQNKFQGIKSTSKKLPIGNININLKRNQDSSNDSARPITQLNLSKKKKSYTSISDQNKFQDIKSAPKKSLINNININSKRNRYNHNDRPAKPITQPNLSKEKDTKKELLKTLKTDSGRCSHQFFHDIDKLKGLAMHL